MTDRWKYRSVIGVTVLPNDEIRTSEVLEIVGEGTERALNWAGIPARLILDSLAFECPLPKEIIKIDWQIGHSRLTQVRQHSPGNRFFGIFFGRKTVPDRVQVAWFDAE